ncbi:MAG: sulfotransferase [Myxococcota bacterium]
MSLPLEAIRRGDWPQAIVVLEKALHAQPHSSQLHALMGVAFLHTGAAEPAGRHLEDALRLDPENIDAMVHLGILAYANRDYEGSIRWCRSVLMRRGEHPLALHHLALSLSEQGAIADALVVWNRLTRVQPQNPDAWVGLGVGLSMSGEIESAADCFQRALITAPNHPEASVRLGLLRVERGELDEGVALLSAHGSHPDARIGLALAAIRRRDFDSAEAELVGVLDVKTPPPLAIEAFARLRLLQDRGAEALPYLDAALSRELPDFARILLLHARGDIRDALKGYDAAFADWARANQMRKTRFDAAQNRDQTDAILQGYSAKRLLRGHTDGHLALFIVGMPRSGTSLLEQMLDNHPEIAGAGELKALHSAARCLPGYPQTASRLSPRTLELAGETYLSALEPFLQPGISRVIDKMPHNFRNLGLIWQALPGARIIHCRRNPMDVLFSCFRQRFGEGMAYTTEMRALAAFYQDYVRLMEHWRRFLPRDVFLEIQYEDLVNDPEPMLRMILSFLDVPWDPAVLHPETNKRVVATASVNEVMQPIYTSSVGRSRRYAKHLQPLVRYLGEDLILPE